MSTVKARLSAALAFSTIFAVSEGTWPLIPEPKRERTPEESAERIAAAQAKRERKAAKRRALVQP